MFRKIVSINNLFFRNTLLVHINKSLFKDPIDELTNTRCKHIFPGEFKYYSHPAYIVDWWRHKIMTPPLVYLSECSCSVYLICYIYKCADASNCKSMITIGILPDLILTSHDVMTWYHRWRRRHLHGVALVGGHSSGRGVAVLPDMVVRGGCSSSANWSRAG